MEQITIKAITTNYEGSSDWEFIGRVTAYTIPNRVIKIRDYSIYVKNFNVIGPRFIAETLDQWHSKYMVSKLSKPIKVGDYTFNAKIGDQEYIYIDLFGE